jgi:hypothetical protein
VHGMRHLRQITDQDICAKCANCSLMEPPKTQPLWCVKALCAAGWPPGGSWSVEANAKSSCPRFEKQTPSIFIHMGEDR